MDLTPIISESRKLPDIYDDVKKSYIAAHTIEEVITEEHIDIFNSIIEDDVISRFTRFGGINPKQVLAHANLVKPYIDYSNLKDTFI